MSTILIIKLKMNFLENFSSFLFNIINTKHLQKISKANSFHTFFINFINQFLYIFRILKQLILEIIFVYMINELEPVLCFKKFR